MGQDMRELLSEVAGTSISGRGRVPRYPHSLIWLPAYWLKHPPQRAVAQRLCAMARLRHADRPSRCPLPGVLQKSGFGALRTVVDPYATYAPRPVLVELGLKNGSLDKPAQSE